MRKIVLVLNAPLSEHVLSHSLYLFSPREMAHCKDSILGKLAEAAARFDDGCIYPTYLQNGECLMRLLVDC
mgnify:CR=1 FL=1